MMFNRLLLITAWIILTIICNGACYGPNPSGQSDSLNEPDTTRSVASIEITHSDTGFVLIVHEKPLFIKGMNWDYFPIGTNYNYSLWDQPSHFIKTALDYEMSLLRGVGVNTIRVYSGIPPKWIQYIYEEYGIFTMVNHSFGRYGLTLNGQWISQTDYSDEQAKNQLIEEAVDLVNRYRNTPGLLMYLLGNENNYGLFWEGAETENIPDHQSKLTDQAQSLYRLFNQAAQKMKAVDTSTPIAICNGDVLFLNLIAEECTDIDILGINVYRGTTFTNLFEEVSQVLSKPVILTEFGVDAFDARKREENQLYQATVLMRNWQHLYSNAAGMDKNGNCLGGFTFQFSDGWWKSGQTIRLNIHDSTASWANGGYALDFVEGQNNMNEEWFGICAKGPTDQQGHYSLHPRVAYFALEQLHQFDPYSSNPIMLSEFFDSLSTHHGVIKLKDQHIQTR